MEFGIMVCIGILIWDIYILRMTIKYEGCKRKKKRRV